MVADEAALLRSAGHAVIQHFNQNPSAPAGAAISLLQAAWNIRDNRALASTIERTSPDVVHVHNTWFASSPSAIRVASSMDIPVVMTLHNYRLLCVNAMLLRNGLPCESCVGRTLMAGVRYHCYNESFGASALAAATTTVHRLLKTWQQHVSVYLALTNFARSLFIRGGLPADKIIVKPNYTKEVGARREAPSTSRTLLFVGRLSKEKGTDALVRIAHMACELQYQVDIVGDGPELGSTEAALDGSPAKVHGRLTGDQIADMMLSSRALLFPSIWYEGYPKVIAEALAAGLPVLGSSIGSVGEIIRRSGGLTVEPNTDRSWRNALEVIDDDQLIDRIGRSSRGEYERNLAEGVAIAQLERVYMAAL